MKISNALALGALVPLLAACPEEPLVGIDRGGVVPPDGGDAAVAEADAEAPVPDAGVQADGGDAAVVPWFSTRGPNGGRLTGLAVDPRDPSTLYASSFHGAMFKSTDRGARWIRARQSAGVGEHADVFAFDPGSPDVIYAAGSGLFKSTDAGDTWSRISFDGDRVGGLAIDPGDGDLIYVASESGMYRSTNGGTRFMPINNRLPANARMTSLVMDPSASRTLYVGTDTGVFKTIDGGSTWTRAGTDLEGLEIIALAIDPATPSTLYAGTRSGDAYKTADSGAAWTPMGGLFGDVTSFAIDPAMPERVYAAIERRGIVLSEDRGDTWRLLPSLGGSSRVVVAAGDVFGAGEEDGVEKSSDAGETWERSNVDLVATHPEALVIGPQDPATLYAGTKDRAFVSRDRAASWEDPATVHLINDLAVAPGLLYAATGGGVFKSEDRGRGWSKVFQGATIAEAVAIDPTSTSTVYAGLAAAEVWKSTNSGGEWTRASEGMTGSHVSSLVVDPSSPRTVYAGTQDGVFKTIDGAKTWTLANNGLPPITRTFIELVLDPTNPSTLYIASSFGVYKSTDRAEIWAPVGGNLGGMSALAISASNPQVLFAGGARGQVYKTTNGGDSWTLASEGLPPDGDVRALAIDPTTPDIAYAGVLDYGVYKTMTGGR